MTKFVALLRGINVGGNKKVPMKELKSLLEKEGFKHVKTLLASGNVVFEAQEEMTKNISVLLEKYFGFPIDVITLPHQVIQGIVKLNPFKAITITPKTRLYVTFSQKKFETKLKIPTISEGQSFKIIHMTDHTIFSVLDLDKTGTVDAMKILEKEFGKKITTRNYNTVVKIAKL